MGLARLRHDRFLAQHPLCCFCGGNTPAATIDHVPSRQMFWSKRRPKGLEFPACQTCNSATGNAEQVMAAFSRIYPEARTNEEKEETERILIAAINNNPGLLQELEPSARQRRNFLKARGLSPLEFPPSDLPLANAFGPIQQRAHQTFGLKLFCALHYEHAQRIVPSTGGVSIRLFTNVEVDEGLIPAELLDLLGPLATLRQGRIDVGDQFFYRFVIGENGNIGSYVAYFRQAFAITGFVMFDISRFPVIEGLTPMPPRRPHLAT